MACRYCDLRGIYSNHVYYPTIPPPDNPSKSYDPLDLPIRTHEDFKTRIKRIEKMPLSKSCDNMTSELGKGHQCVFVK